MNFSSDTAAPAHPKVIEHLAQANAGPAASYGDDGWTLQAEALLSDLFEAPLRAGFIASGTASNALALGLLCPPTGGVICHQHAHIYCDERGAVEFFSHGAKLLPLTGEHGRMSPEALQDILQKVDERFVHAIPPKALSLSNLNESGCVYSAKQTARLASIAHDHGLSVHVDGARLVNALAFTGAKPAELTWASGVDVLSFGLTKTGAMGAETILLFGANAERFDELEARRKRAGHMPPKQRFVAAQIIALLEDRLWLELAAHANEMAAALADGLQNLGVPLLHPVEGNEVFAALTADQSAKLQEGGAAFHVWPDGSARFVTCWNTEPEEISKALALL
ncbi:MAG: threonine aldolase [Robiginitomaculum sp.]|nr:MAG: threonine aldolase [Robiginitomaculum sp.]